MLHFLSLSFLQEITNRVCIAKPSIISPKKCRKKLSGNIFSSNEQPKIFTGGVLVFISGKFVIDNSEQCITITYASIINNNSSRKFDTTNIPLCILHCMFSVVVNHKPKELREFIHFGVECTKYNSVTSNSSINMQITVLYHAGSLRFQNYLGHLGSNIKLGIPKVVDPTIPSVNRNAAATPGSSDNLINPDVQIDSSCKRNQKQSSVYIDLDAQDEEEKQSDHDDNEKDTELDEEEESQTEKRKRVIE
ncbi:hypothetical protein C2G38_2027244 [Gigaspora rosea]|uniref:Uncharacterized protein n=1 Tax=Gigaspora rosea TaxID=44941 RepID=A0A397W5E5_9GLOM|nr:hypothetical protein C2G38_2027244 [Gigaspora rosea]